MILAQEDSTGIIDNEVLDQFTIPFGTWIEQAVNWTTINLKWLLDGIAWPFEFLLSNIVDNFLLEIPWVAVVGIMFAIAWLVRNLSVATATAVGLTVCGLLGPLYWVQTARTIGLILVAVIVCVIIGIPVGIMAGRVDGVWKVVRPTLDAMQVIHAFVYLLPFVYFWGVGRVSSTMATMVFALPPLIRLTNLGIRQVPEDVVEASRAYGAPEFRVLTDVQLPLARPAIMTGINQTLLLAFSMLGIAAILGAGGLGQLLFRALGQQDVSLAAASGLAFFILAVILDRISQTDGSGSGLLKRMTAAWRARIEPEVLLSNPDFNPAVASSADDEADDKSEGGFAEVGTGERSSIVVAAVGGIVMLVSPFLIWGNDASLLTGYSRRADEEMAGSSFSGWLAEGGSWFAYGVFALGLLVVLAGINVWSGASRGGRWLSPEGAFFGALGGLLIAFGYWVTNPSEFTVGYNHGIGVYVALGGALLATVGAGRWMGAAPYAPRRPLQPRVAPAPIILGAMAAVLALISMFSSWTLDERADAVITPEIQAEIDEVLRASRAGEVEPGVAASEIQIIRAKAEVAERIVIDGKSNRGPGLGIWVLVLSGLGLLGALVSAGVAGLDDRRQWIGGTVAMGFGAGVLGIAIGWAGSLARATDTDFFSGVGVLVALLAGLLLFVAGKLLVAAFERSKVYDDEVQQDDATVSTEAAGRSGVPQPV